MKTSSRSVAEQLCLACGLCCDGTLFRDVELQPSDDAAKLASLGLPLQSIRRRQKSNPDSLKSAVRRSKFPQPCAALGADCRCHIYGDRPSRCREFECALFKAVAGGETEAAAALRTIRQARERADRARTLYRALGDADEHTPLSLRFKRLQRRLECDLPDEATAATYADLTLAVHELQLLLRQKFYPNPAG